MAVDVCDALYSHCSEDEVVRKNFGGKLEALRRLRGDLAAGRRHGEAARAMYYGDG